MSTELVFRGEVPTPFELIERSRKLGDNTKLKYKRVLEKYLGTGGSLDDAEALGEFSRSLVGSQRAFLKAAVGRWAKAMSNVVKAQATPDNEPAVQATLHRLEALTSAIELDEPKGSKLHTWLAAQQVRALSSAVGNGIVGARDRAVLGLMVSAGLRRAEVCSLRFDDIERVPNGEGVRVVLHVKGKGKKARSVPVSDKLAQDLLTWGSYVGDTGFVARALGRNREPSDGAMSEVAVFKLVRKYGGLIDKPELAPHDLRRTFAKLSYNEGKGVDIAQLSLLLGHESVETTMSYLGLELDLTFTGSDLVPW